MSKAWSYDDRLKHAPIPARCPACKDTFDPFLRGQFAETFLMFPTGRTCLICYQCKQIVGYESYEGGFHLLDEDQIGHTAGTRLADFFSNAAAAIGLFIFGLVCLLGLLAVWSLLAVYWLALVIRDGRRPR